MKLSTKLSMKKIALLTLLALTVACTSTDNSSTAQSSRSGVSTGGERMVGNLETAMLVNKDWQLVEINGESISYEKTKVTPTLMFSADAKSVSGTSSCNNFMGHVKINGNEISFGNLTSTKKACLDQNIEKQYLQTLAKSAYANVDGYELTLLDANKTQILKFLQP